VALIHCADVFAGRMATQMVEFDKGLDFDQEALNTLQLTDATALQDYMENYRELVKGDLEAVTQFDQTREA
jgi:hypothetical protein